MITWKHFGQAQIRRRGARRCFYKPRPSHRKKGGTVNCVPVLNTMHSSNFDRCWWCGRTTRQTTRSKTLSAQLILSDPPKTGRDLILGKSLRRSMGEESGREGLQCVSRGDKLRSDSYVVPPLPLFSSPFKDGKQAISQGGRERGPERRGALYGKGASTEPPCSFEISLNHSVLLRRAYSLSRAI